MLVIIQLTVLSRFCRTIQLREYSQILQDDQTRQGTKVFAKIAPHIPLVVTFGAISTKFGLIHAIALQNTLNVLSIQL